ncbi:signal recognition particle-docking protein FtsY [Apilactobacillus xinyiensis]|uniref:signal recognition particle-docking protein FtsY n=1 Tax=Apilactobacillus xinyiensis TaxID=2841032 RepID=UPI00200F2A33|nr:signal recognition particle-docking protein FtsY [Apilactobacillus xinyiensis]MCL0329430.1 signal recognition particle-docking protein FtsY [Apilactobacillus xinyiensis]
MGLFDIFKRKKKKNKVEEQAQSNSDGEKNRNESDDELNSASQSNGFNGDVNSSEIKDNKTDSSENNVINEQSEESKIENHHEEVDSNAETVVEYAESNLDDTKTKESKIDNNDEKANNLEQPEQAEPNASEENQESESTNDDFENANDVSLEDEENNIESDNENEEEKYDKGLKKTRSSFMDKLNRLFANFRSVDEDFFEDLEDTLIESDVGFDMAVKLTDELRDEVKLQNAKDSEAVKNVIVKKMIDIYDEAGNGENNNINLVNDGLSVIMFVGVNGVGKTTTIGKMAKLYKDQGKKVLLAAADTFRAGAIQQLNVWAQRDGVDIVKKEEGSDPAAVVYEAVQKAQKDNYDVLFVDTAGRLQNKVNLMNELAKMKKVLTREIPEAPHEVLLTLDATTGQNALNQAKLFKEVTNVTGIVLTKLDGTAKGGIILAIRNELHLPVKYVGLGEKVTDLSKFNPSEYVYGLFKDLVN